VIGRSIEHESGASPVKSIINYLQAAKTATARCLAKKAVVIIDPLEMREIVAWPLPGSKKPSAGRQN
jgi:hypothetical protein